MTIPDGFLRFSAAIDRLAQGMWGGLPRPAPVRAVKREYRQYKKEISVGFGPWREEAGKLLLNSVTGGKLAVYVSGSPQIKTHTFGLDPMVVPKEILARMILVRGTLPDHTIRPSMKITGGDGKFSKLLESAILLLRTKEFDAWYRSERAKGKWPSQRTKLKRRQGRPSKQSDGLRNAVTVAVCEHQTSIAQLRRDLLASGRTDVPGRDTIGRLVDQLYRESGDVTLRRRRRAPRKSARSR